MTVLVWTTVPLNSVFSDVPSTPGVYQFMGTTTPLYIGKSVNLRARLRSHYHNTKLDAKEQAVWQNSKAVRFTIVDNDFMAILLESKLIKEYQPPYNRIAKDDTSFLYIAINYQDLFPKPDLVRARDLSNSTINFGPFPSRVIAEEILHTIRHLIPFCTAKQLGKRACFYSHLGLCSPCPNTIIKLSTKNSQLSINKYRRQIRQVIKILRGNTKPVISELSRQLHNLNSPEEYEQALTLRRKIDNFQHWIETHSFSDTRTLILHQSSSRLHSLQTLLFPYLGETPLSRIECYDASNLISGTDTVAMVVLTNGQIDKSEYRRFKIKNIRANSDFARLEEALTRRFKNSWPSPNLIVLDGGKPQVRMAERILDQLPTSLHLIGLAKNPDRLIIPQKDKFLTLSPPLNHPGFSLLKLIRDESHRFANSYRRILQKKSMYN